jgi:DNA polymerase alpha-associated DNA helicase A
MRRCSAALTTGSRTPLVAMTRARRHLVSSLPWVPTYYLIHTQCVVGDSSTVQHGSKYLKDWLAWLEDNADVRYAGLD